jgi:acyl CoA:acetate/3-ketoacid CoA transferase beta subunit
MEHTTKDNEPKIVKRCTYPLSGLECVKTILTDMAVIDVTPKGLVLREVAPGLTPEDVQFVTEPRLIVPATVPEMNLPPIANLSISARS